MKGRGWFGFALPSLQIWGSTYLGEEAFCSAAGKSGNSDLTTACVLGIEGNFGMEGNVTELYLSAISFQRIQF